MTTEAYDCDPEEYEEVFQVTSTDPYAWRQIARAIAAHAELAEQAFNSETLASDEMSGVVSVNLMQWGQAIESALKAASLSIGCSTTELRKMSHSLEQLAQKAGLPISDQERFFLLELTELVVWAGKYPAPKTWSARRDLNHWQDCSGRGTLTAFTQRITDMDSSGRTMARDIFNRAMKLG